MESATTTLFFYPEITIKSIKEGKQMNNLIKINNKDLQVKEFKDQRVVTLKDIDMVHERPEGTARRNFNENKGRFIEAEDFFNISLKDENRTLGIDIPNRGITVLTESGYLMLVKSLTDDLAWEVQRQLVNNYFRGKELANTLNELSPELQLLINMELKQKQLESQITETKEELAAVKENIIADVEDWRQWVNQRLKAIGAALGDYKRPRTESYTELERRGRCNLERRLENRLENMKLAGANKTAIRKTNYLDVINDDSRLKEIYTTIVKEMCIRHL